ncbi:dipeptidase 1 isoform X2 [Poecilia latipinna]|uniref:dipeptidase 1 isoform X2 n=1 Tax=Poecilia latipinna TaxID=48699 RepID=UPI00072EA7A3|nr:PREDICTED: dipeptidase 1-like isoform X2 [Poecilia latipinna]
MFLPGSSKAVPYSIALFQIAFERTRLTAVFSSAVSSSFSELREMSYRKTLLGASCSLCVHSLRALLAFSLCCFISGYSEKDRAHNLLSKYPIIDGHNDLALRLRIHYNNQLSKINLTHLTRVATDISRLRAGHVQTQMFAVYVLCGAQHMDAVRLTLEQIDVIRRICTEYPDFELVTSTQELRDSMTKGKIACLISIEGGHSIDSSLPALRMFYQLGVRSMSLTHSCNTPWAESSTNYYKVFVRSNNSLTTFGKAVVDEMNRLGMIVDLSHTSFETASAVLNHSKAPVIFSHSSSYMICNNPRNVPDWLLQELKDNRGLIMVNFYSPFISCQKKATVSHLADHFDYIKGFIGAKSIGIGGDFDGGTSFPVGLEDVSKYPVIVQELLKRNWTEEDLADVLRNNFLRVFEEVEKVRNELSWKKPSEEEIPLTEVANKCRLELKQPIIPSNQSPSLKAKGHNLLFLALALLFYFFP